MASSDWTPRQLAAEFVATTLFVWIGTGSAVASGMWTDGNDPARLLTISVAFGLGISVLAYGIGHISGGHINPAVTLAFVSLGDVSVAKGLLYMLAQCIGAILGSLVVWGCAARLTETCDAASLVPVCVASFTKQQDFGPAFFLGINSVAPGTTLGSAFLLELVGTFLLVLTVLNSARDNGSAAGNAAPTAIGWSVLLAHVNLIPFTGCGINPARTLGPHVVASIAGIASEVWIRGAWVYYVAPFVGALLAAATYRFVLASPEEAAAGEPSKEEDEVK